AYLYPARAGTAYPMRTHLGGYILLFQYYRHVINTPATGISNRYHIRSVWYSLLRIAICYSCCGERAGMVCIKIFRVKSGRGAIESNIIRRYKFIKCKYEVFTITLCIIKTKQQEIGRAHV